MAVDLGIPRLRTFLSLKSCSRCQDAPQRSVHQVLAILAELTPEEALRARGKLEGGLFYDKTILEDVHKARRNEIIVTLTCDIITLIRSTSQLVLGRRKGRRIGNGTGRFSKYHPRALPLKPTEPDRMKHYDWLRHSMVREEHGLASEMGRLLKLISLREPT
ncbi:hypothetical protein PoB_006413600 [Plakobranchus ocellatus]|uniref:Uncharacterized protein n=1 Tax=Plakobranchus ocellatus TaxID=259542 RepID=A0AAV4D088_9GAST|nr:hypothetical protein PoB_006413600 [Plakobranchus ocellatus]